MKQFGAVLAAVALLLTAPGQVFAATELGAKDQVTLCNDPHNYEITAESPEWAEMTLPERINACAVSVAKVEGMTTAALVETVLNYPFLVNIYAYDTVDEGIEVVSSYFPGLPELLSREDATDALCSYLEAPMNTFSTNEDNTFETISAKSLLSYLRSVRTSFSVFDEANSSVTRASGIVWTPKGNAVSAYIDLTWSDHNTTEKIQQGIQLRYLTVYPSTRYKGAPNPSYNCHSYAFVEESNQTRYWLNDPLRYLNDGSYIQTTANGQGGLRLVYNTAGERNHSAITVAGSSQVISKWGPNGLFQHDVDDCPYAFTNTIYTYFYRA